MDLHKCSARVRDLKTAVKAGKEEAPLLNLDLGPFYKGCLYLVLLATPFMRGLFFLPELLAAITLIGVCFIFACWDQAMRKETAVFRTGMDYAAAGYVLAYGASLITAVHPWEAVRSLMAAAAMVMVYYAAGRAAANKAGAVLNVMYLAAVGVALIGAGAALGWISFPGAFDRGVIMSTLQYKNALAVYLAAFSVIGLALSARPDSLFARCLYAAGNFILITVILCTQSRGGWLLYPAGIAALAWGMPPSHRWRVIYHFLIFAGPGLFTIRKFLPLISAGDGAGAARYLLAGLALTVVLQACYHFLAALINRQPVEQNLRRLVAYSGVGYLALVAAVYVFYASNALSLSAGGVLPGQIVSRAESIARQDTSLPDRLEMTADAVRIALDYPLGAGGGGWNALYHRYQSSLYYSTEAHNHFAQTWVEAGVAGLAALAAVWVFFVLTAVALWKRHPRGDDWVLVWSVVTAAGVLGVHSAFDFDMSLPALGIVLWTLLGVAGQACAGVRKPGGPELKNARSGVNRKIVVFALCGTVLGLAAAVPAVMFYRAGYYAALGAKKMLAGDYGGALVNLAAAHGLNPLMGNYMGDMAQCSAALAADGNDAVRHYQAIEWAERASRAEPYNYRLRFAMANVYLLLGEFDRAAAEAEGAAAANPNARESYVLLGETGVLAALYHLERDRDGPAREYLARVKGLPGVIQERRKALKHGGDRLAVTPELEFSLARAAFLEGNYGLAEAGMRKLKLPGREDHLRAWLAAAVYKNGGREEGEKLAGSLDGKDGPVNLYKRLVGIRSL
ncbi:MAG: O-antigen ligase family protein [Peptococcaceae bacterium]|nr:O-antigen ligase family protein [Peptococcaceae bacterium]